MTGAKILDYKQMNKKIIKNQKVLAPVKIMYLVIFLLIIGMVILYSSGTFDSPGKIAGTTSVQKPNDDVHGGADLNKLSEIESLKEKVRANPDDQNSLLQLAHLLNDSRFYSQAITEYNLYLQKNPESPDVIVDMGVCYYQLRNFDKAIETMKSAITINPEHQIAHFNLGIVTQANGEHDAAIEWWQKAIAINPDTDIAQKAKNLIDSH